jgi:undecaprenyl-diphosphatase
MASFASSVIMLRYDRRIGIPAVILAALIALSRLYLYVHFPTDVLVGTLMGIFFAFLAKRILDHFFPVAAKDAVKRTEKAGRENS